MKVSPLPTDQSAGTVRSSWTTAAPAAFVLLWSTGFIGAKLGLPVETGIEQVLLGRATLEEVRIPVEIWRRQIGPGFAQHSSGFLEIGGSVAVDLFGAVSLYERVRLQLGVEMLLTLRHQDSVLWSPELMIGIQAF